MAFLTPDKTIKLSVGNQTLTVKQKIIPDSLRADKYVASYVQKGQTLKPCKKLGDTGKPAGITVHNTGDIKVAAGTNAAEQYCRATYNGNMRGVVVHYYVWRSEIWQLLRLDEQGWHATDGSTRRAARRPGQKIGGNLDTIAIEAIGPERETERTTALLCAWLCDWCVFDPKLDIYQHNYFYPAKNCPVYIRPHWAQFLQDVTTAMGTGASGYTSYTVKPGDSWWGIAAREMGGGKKMAELAAFNGKTTASLIRPGDKLRIPKK